MPTYLTLAPAGPDPIKKNMVEFIFAVKLS